jgi:hypothetical protein
MKSVENKKDWDRGKNIRALPWSSQVRLLTLSNTLLCNRDTVQAFSYLESDEGETHCLRDALSRPYKAVVPTSLLLSYCYAAVLTSLVNLGGGRHREAWHMMVITITEWVIVKSRLRGIAYCTRAWKRGCAYKFPR